MKTKRLTKNKIKLKTGESQRNDGVFRYSWYDRFGKRHYLYSSSLPELRKKEDELNRMTLQGIDYSRLECTVNDYFELWKKIKTGIRETTFANYVRIYERYISSDFGKTKLKNVTYSRVVLFFNNLVIEKGLRFGSIRNIEVTLSMVLDIAVKDEVIKNNPCKGALKELQRACASNTKEVRALTLEEQKLFENYLAKPGRFHAFYPLFTVMLWTGMRVGEVLGLRWQDIDFENNEISVNHTLMYYDKGVGKGSAYKINPPKTKSSYRIVPMLPKVKEAFLEQREYLNNTGIRCKAVIDGYTDFIFINTVGNVYSHKKLNYKLYSISEEINKELSMNKGTDIKAFPKLHNHMLRHTFATRMREAGADMKATSEMMGHEGILITLTTYTDATSEFKKREISLLEDYLTKAM